MGTMVGVGLNANSREFEESLMATSLCLACGDELVLDSVLQLLVERFRRRWAQFLIRDRALSKEYTDLLWSKGRWASMILDGSPVTLRPMDVDEQGRLLVEQEDGKVMAFGLDHLRFAAR